MGWKFKFCLLRMKIRALFAIIKNRLNTSWSNKKYLWDHHLEFLLLLKFYRHIKTFNILILVNWLSVSIEKKNIGKCWEFSALTICFLNVFLRLRVVPCTNPLLGLNGYLRSWREQVWSDTFHLSTKGKAPVRVAYGSNGSLEKMVSVLFMLKCPT